MSIDLSSISGSISNLYNSYFTSKSNNENESKDVKEQIKDYASKMMTSRRNLADYMKNTEDSFNGITGNESSSKLISAISKMKSTNSMSSIEKYKYMMEQAQNFETIDTSEPDAEKLLSKSEQIIQKVLTQGISAGDSVKLSKALTAKQVALSRLDMIG